MLRRSLSMLASYIALAGVLGACGGWPYVTTRDAVLLQDDFDAENRGRPELMYDRFTHWHVKDGTVDLVGVGSDWDFQPGHGLYVDLDGDRPDGVRFEPGVLSSRQAFELTPGVYELSFRLAGSQRGDTNTTEVRLGRVYRERITLSATAPFRQYVNTFRVRHSQTARLYFDNEGADGYGLLLDAVTLRRTR